MEKRICPYCGEEIAATAKKCRFCGEWFTENNDSQPVSSPKTVSQSPSIQDESPRTPSAGQHPTVHVESVEEKGFFKTYFMDSFIRPYANFTGYTSRKEFWLTYVAMIIISLGLTGIALLIFGLTGAAGMMVAMVVMALVSLAFVIPGLAISCRRLRDGGFNPWMILLSLVPFIGPLALLVLFCLPSKSEYEQSDSRFNTVDTMITGGCILLAVAGIWLSISSLSGLTDSGYDLGDDEAYLRDEASEVEPVIPVEEIGRADDDTIAVPVKINDRILTDVDESLLDLVWNPQEIFESGAPLVNYRIGNDYDKIFNETGSTHTSFKGTGQIGDNSVSLKCWLTEDGELHGRYTHENGTKLDANGYIQAGGSLYIQLGHDSQKSEWILQPVSDEIPGTYRYEGFWGRNRKPSYLVFVEESY